MWPLNPTKAVSISGLFLHQLHHSIRHVTLCHMTFELLVNEDTNLRQVDYGHIEGEGVIQYDGMGYHFS
jgi:hypothetical protein